MAATEPDLRQRRPRRGGHRRRPPACGHAPARRRAAHADLATRHSDHVWPTVGRPGTRLAAPLSTRPPLSATDRGRRTCRRLRHRRGRHRRSVLGHRGPNGRGLVPGRQRRGHPDVGPRHRWRLRRSDPAGTQPQPGRRVDTGPHIHPSAPAEPVMTSSELATRLDLTMTPDPCRVIIKLFVPGEDAALVHTRASAIIERIAHLDENESSLLLSRTLKHFGTRHRNIEATFRHHYDLVRHRVAASSDLSPTARALVGAYFSHEYAVEAAALCNPSMVAHPDQSALRPAQLRVAISLRQIGEGHISSIGFATGVLGPDTRLAVAGRSGPLQTGRRSTARHRRDL